MSKELVHFGWAIKKLLRQYDKWLYLLKNLAFLDEIPTKLRDKAFQKVFQIAEIAKYNPKERQNYENSLKYYRDMENSLDLKYAKGLQEGKEEGLKEGEQNKTLEIVKNLIVIGLDNETIAKGTGLSIAEIEAIRKEMK